MMIDRLKKKRREQEEERVHVGSIALLLYSRRNITKQCHMTFPAQRSNCSHVHSERPALIQTKPLPLLAIGVQARGGYAERRKTT